MAASKGGVFCRNSSSNNGATLVVVLVVLWCAAAAAQTPAAPKVCRPQWQNGRAQLDGNCSWEQSPVPAGASHLIVAGPASTGVLPTMTLNGDAEAGPAGGYSLSIKRLVLRNLALTPASGAGGLPRLLPLGLFDSVPRNLTIMDCRIFVSPETFQEYLAFFKKQLRTSRNSSAAGPSMHTDYKSVINVPYYGDSSTEMYSVTLVSGPCNAASASDAQFAIQQLPAGCNMRTANNASLVPMLLRDAGIVSTDPLLMRLTTNITLGPGLTQSIPIRRPIVLLGMASALTSIDLAMMVNQLNVTLPYGSITWQSLTLENLAPGDAVSSTVAPPFSTTVSTNIWAMYCNRSASSCLNLSNVTLSIPGQDELNYQVFMYTMYNSPAPALRDLTDFYRSELNTKTIQFVPGPDNNTLTLIRLLSDGWDLWYVVSTLKSYVAPKRPLPRQAFVMQKYRAGALVYALEDCSGFVSALSSRSTSTRTRVWTLIGNVTLGDKGEAVCPWPDGNVTYPTQLLGPYVHTHGPSTRVFSGGSAVASPLSPEAIVLGHADAAHNRSSAAAAVDLDVGYDQLQRDGPSSATPLDEFYSLSFGYIPGLFQLPVEAQDKFMQIQNITLTQLPQMSPERGGLRGLLRRRLLQHDAADGLPVGIWTILLWSFKRTMSGLPVTISDSQLVIPQPEFDALASKARKSPSFALQLQGQAGGLTFTGVNLLHNGTLLVRSFQGPGVAGTNLWLLPDPEAASIQGYSWPYHLFEGSSDGGSSSGSYGSGSHQSVGLRAGIGVAVGVLGLLAMGLVFLVFQLRKRHAQHHSSAALHADPKLAAAGAGLAGAGDLGPTDTTNNGAFHSPSKQPHKVVTVQEAADADVLDMHDTLGKLPQEQQQGGLNGAAIAAVAAGGGAAAVAAAAATATKTNSQRSSDEFNNKSRRCSSSTTVDTEQPCDGSSVDPAAAAAGAAGGERPAASTGSQSGSVEQTIAHGLERWNAAVSQTTLQIMQRRLQSNNALYGHVGTRSGSSSNGCSTSQPHHGAPSGLSQSAGSATASSAAAGGGDGDQGLQLHSVIGSGSFGQVMLGSWRGKRVAVKVMHLQNNALLGSSGEQQQDRRNSNDSQNGSHGDGEQQQQDEEQRRRLQRQRAQNSPPQMAIMEAVVSSTMSHPNVVQVYTYYLSPLMVQPGQTPGAAATPQQQQQQQQGQGHLGDKPGADKQSNGVFGWSLRLVMQYCEEGTLRDALDKRRLPRLPGTSFPHPSIVFSLSHDVAAAMLHLHSEGIVHGDLKAGNVLLTANITPGGAGGGTGNSCSDRLGKSVEVWTAAGSKPLSAKVADFGLALPLGPQDTHATMLARGTPTHMSPELFISGHVSKASDVFAYGVLLYELITGSRAYAGVPIPLLPHEVAMQGLRPQWPKHVPADCQELRNLAEACWAQKPQDRPTFDTIMKVLEGTCTLPPQQPSQQQQRRRSGLGGHGGALHGLRTLPGQQHPQQQQQVAGNAESHQPAVTPLLPAAGGGAAAAAAAANSPAVDRKASREPMSWSEISYGGSKHEGGWS